MKCPRCGVDAIISASRNKVEGDDSPERQTRLFRVLTFRCRNPQCEENGREVGTQRLEQPLGG